MSALRPSICKATRVLSPRRFLHQTTAVRMAPYKDDMDRESLKPKAHEYTQSGTDDDVAAHKNASFNPAETSPEAEKDMAAECAARKGKQNALDSSPADINFAKGGAKSGVEGGAGPPQPPERTNKSSGVGKGPKGKTYK
ncbi:hypothetical protein GGR50DRAFT_249968 [Xylaria sp. CBS 124048]|nr:hypothetical protein GGR50DRAFT_249968 [Xylaria sp. CBS 124048]